MKNVVAESLGTVHTIHLKTKKHSRTIKREKGITLLALVITIIVLLIVAGVSIATLTGNNGILTQAQNAKTKTEIAAAKENIELKVIENSKLNDDMKSLSEDLSSMKEVKIIGETDEEIIGKYNEYVFVIDQDKNVTMVNNLVTNGFLENKNNTNFPGLNYKDGFLTITTSADNKHPRIETDQLIEVDTSKKYLQSMTMKSSNQDSTSFAGLMQYDIDKNIIDPQNYLFKEGTTTYLTKDLNDGDTKIYLNDVSNYSFVSNAGEDMWFNGIIIWNYKDSTGHQYPEETYSRNAYSGIIKNNNVDKTNNVITLEQPWSYGKVEKGIKISQTSSGGTYNYGVLWNESISSEWKTYNNIISGENNVEDYEYSYFRPGTKYVKFIWLMNYFTDMNVTIDLKNIIFCEIN